MIVLQFETMKRTMTTMREVNRDKTKVRINFFFSNVSLVNFAAELDE